MRMRGQRCGLSTCHESRLQRLQSTALALAAVAAAGTLPRVPWPPIDYRRPAYGDAGWCDPCRAQQSIEKGKIINLMSADVDNVLQFIHPALGSLLVLPLTILVSMVLLYRQIRCVAPARRRAMQHMRRQSLRCWPHAGTPGSVHAARGSDVLVRCWYRARARGGGHLRPGLDALRGSGHDEGHHYAARLTGMPPAGRWGCLPAARQGCRLRGGRQKIVSDRQG